MNTFFQDFRYSLRSMLRSPGFFAVAVVTLALAIGANTAIFSMVNAILFRPYPYPEPDQLVVFRSVNPQNDIQSGNTSILDHRDYLEQNTVFQDIALVRNRSFNLGGVDEPVRVKGAAATASLFRVIGGPVTLGRTFTDAEDVYGGEKVVVLSEELWARMFQSDPEILGKTIKLDGEVYTVVGVVPPSSQFPDTDVAKLFVPLAPNVAEEYRHSRTNMAIARLKPGVSKDQAQEEMTSINRRLAKDFPETNEGWGTLVLTLREFRTRRFTALSFILLGVVGLVLLIACVNVANLLLQRSSVRRREIAIRSAVGASRGRVVTQLLTESLVLALVGGLVGLLLAWWGLKLLVRAIPEELPSYMANFSLDGQVLLFMAGISLLTAVLFGLAPALRLSKPNLTESLTDAGSRGAGGGTRQGGRNALIVAEVALSLVLLIAAGLMIKSFLRLQNVDPGFDPSRTLTFQVTVPDGKYPGAAERKLFLRRAIEELGSVPGVVAVGTTTDLPIGEGPGARFTVDGQSEEQRKNNPVASFRLVHGDFFRAAGLPIVQGRGFQVQDFGEVQRSLVVSQRFAERYWPGESGVGKRVRLDLTDDDPFLNVIGVAGNLKGPGSEEEGRLEVYAPYPLLDKAAYTTNDFIVRTQGNPVAAARSVRQEIRGLDADLPLTNLRTMEQVLSESLWLQRISSTLFTIFAAVALILATVGMYGSMAYSISQRTHEIGIRMALGARAGDVLRMILRQGLILVAVAMVLGLAGAFGLGRVLRRLLFEVRATDPATYVVVSAILLLVALVAIWIPARRATKVLPVIALKQD